MIFGRQGCAVGRGWECDFCGACCFVFALTTRAVKMGFSCFAEFSRKMHLGVHLSTAHSRLSKRAKDCLSDAVAGRADGVVPAHSPHKRARPQLTPCRTRESAGLAGLSRTTDRIRPQGADGESRITYDKPTDGDVDKSLPKDALKDSARNSSSELHQRSNKDTVDGNGGAPDVNDNGDVEQHNKGGDERAAEDGIGHDSTCTGDEASTFQFNDAEAQDHDRCGQPGPTQGAAPDIQEAAGN